MKRAFVLMLCACVTAEVKPPIEPVAAVRAPDLLSLPNAPDAEFRAKKPPTSNAPVTFKAPVPVELKLKNGARVLVVENRAVPIVAIDVAIPIGADVVPVAKAGLSQFVANMLKEATRSHGRLELAEAIDALALQVSSTSERETVHLRLGSLTETTPAAIDLLAEMLTQPAFHGDDVERVRTLMLTGVVQRKAWPTAVAFDEADRLLYGDTHPLGQPSTGTPASLKAITAAELKSFHQRWYRPNEAVIAVAGDISPTEAVALLEARLGGWQGKVPSRPKLPAVPALKNRVVLFDTPGTSQSQVWLISRLVSAKDPDAIAAMVVNNVLGGMFGSRLNMTLREAKSWSYGVFSAADLLRNSGMFELWGSIETPHAADALAEYFAQVEGLASGQWRPGELANAKETIIRALPSMLETNSAVAAAMTGLALDGLPLDYFNRLPELVAKVDERDIARVVSKYLVPANMSAIVVGPRETLQEKLEALNRGPLENR